MSINPAFTLQGSQVRNLHRPPNIGETEQARKSLRLRAFSLSVASGHFPPHPTASRDKNPDLGRCANIAPIFAPLFSPALIVRSRSPLQGDFAWTASPQPIVFPNVIPSAFRPQACASRGAFRSLTHTAPARLNRRPRSIKRSQY